MAGSVLVNRVAVVRRVPGTCFAGCFSDAGEDLANRVPEGLRDGG